MADRPMHVLQVSTRDIGGGAERIAFNLFQAYRAKGHFSKLAVGFRHSDDEDVFSVPNDDYRDADPPLRYMSGNMLLKGLGFLQSIVKKKRHSIRQKKIQKGYEDFEYPGTRQLLDHKAINPDIVHCHNLHGGYFDLRLIPWISKQVPLLLTLHDAWLLSGHCAHSFDCERWQTGCGKCPDLTIYPAIRSDATTYNWRRKRKIYSRSRFYVVVPSQWLMNKVMESMLAQSIVLARVIPNGVDLSVFKTADQEKVRIALGLPREAVVLLFVANGIQNNVFKDYLTMRKAVALVAARKHDHKLIFLALGADAPAEKIDEAEVQFIPYQKDPAVVAQYHQAADIYIHASNAEVWGLTITEALACGTPVVVTSVGGIPEQVNDGVTGFLTPPGDPEMMAFRIQQLIDDVSLRETMGRSAAADAKSRFNIDRMADEYLNWYREILK